MKFYLVRPKDDTSSIYLDINFKSMRLRLSTGIVVKSNSWDTSKEVVTRKVDNYTVINNNLRLIRSSIDNFINNLKINRKELSKDEFTEQVLDVINPDRPKSVIEREDQDIVIHEEEISIMDELDKWISARKNSEKYSESSNKKYRGCYNKLIEFKKKKRFKINYENMNLDFYNKFTKYLNRSGLVNNSVGVHIKILKTFLREMEKQGKKVNIEYREFKAFKDPEPPTYALTNTEIEAIEAVESISKKLEKTRDLFIAQLHLLVRVSDLMKIRKEHIDIETKTIKIFVKKTKRPNILPITTKLLHILEKYNYTLPKISEQKYNDYLKELAMLAGFDKPVEIARPKGAGSEVQVLPKYKVMSSNMVRRSGITGLLRRKVPSKMIMQISGHKKLAVFERYIRMEQQESLDAVRDAWDEV